MSANGVIQTALTIAKTTQTVMGSEIGIERADTMTLFLDYVKGDETGVDVIANYRRVTGGQLYPATTWTDVAGVNTALPQKIRLTASGHYAFRIYFPAIDFVVFTQGGSNNDGTPTGTLAASYVFEQ